MQKGARHQQPPNSGWSSPSTAEDSAIKLQLLLGSLSMWPWLSNNTNIKWIFIAQMLLRTQCWQTSVEQKLQDKEKATVAKRKQTSWTASPVWKYDSSKINPEVNKLKQELPHENANHKHNLNLKHAKKNLNQPTPAASTTKITLGSILATMSQSTKITKTTISGTTHNVLVITCWRWNFKSTWTQM